MNPRTQALASAASARQADSAVLQATSMSKQRLLSHTEDNLVLQGLEPDTFTGTTAKQKANCKA